MSRTMYDRVGTSDERPVWRRPVDAAANGASTMTRAAAGGVEVVGVGLRSAVVPFSQGEGTVTQDTANGVIGLFKSVAKCLHLPEPSDSTELRMQAGLLLFFTSMYFSAVQGVYQYLRGTNYTIMHMWVDLTVALVFMGGSSYLTQIIREPFMKEVRKNVAISVEESQEEKEKVMVEKVGSENPG